MGKAMKRMAAFFKRCHARTATLSAPDPTAGHRQPTPLPETPGHSRASLGWSLVESLLLSPGSWCAQSSVCALPESISLSCVSSGSSLVGLMATSSKRAYATPRSDAPEPLALWQATADPYLLRRHSNTQRQVWFSLCEVWCAQGFVCTLQESASQALCKFWQLYGGINSNLLQEGLCHTQVYCTQSPYPCSSPLLTCTSAGDTQTQFCLSLWGLWVIMSLPKLKL